MISLLVYHTMSLNNTKLLKLTNIRESSEFKLFYKEYILPRINKQRWCVSMIRSDVLEDQYLLSDDDPRSYVYQYNQFVQLNNREKLNCE